MAFPLRVFGARAVVQLDKPEKVTLGGIVIPDANPEPIHQGTIVAVGDGLRMDDGSHFPMAIAVGDRVIYSPIAGAPVDVSGYPDETFVVINEADVLAVVE